MATNRIGSCAALVLCAMASHAGVSSAAPTSFSGNFANDSDQREFFFTVPASGSISIRTFSYAGGANGSGTRIPAGGFDPTLSLYDSSGALIAVNQDAGCGAVPADPVTSSCWDALIATTLPAGNYRVVLTQSVNLPAGPTLADSFLYNPLNLFQGSNTVNNVPTPPFGGQADFTQAPGGAPAGFWDFYPNKRTSFFALDINGASAATAPGVTTSALPFGIAGSVYAPVSLTVQGSPGVSYVWTPNPAGMPPGLTLSAAGVLSGTPTAKGSFTFTVTATDGVQPIQLPETIVVYDPLLITTAALPGVTGPASYGPVQLAASGGSGSLTWSATGLPASLTLSAAGSLAGTVGSSLSFTVAARDAVTGQTASKLLSITFTAPLLQISGGGNLSEIIAGGSVSAIFGASGGTAPYTFSASGLPPGLSLAASTGAVTGTVTTPGNYTFAVSVGDAGGQTASSQAALSVLGFVSAAPAPGVKGSSYSYTFTAAGGTGPYTFSGTGVPGGLTLAVSGALTGQPSAAGQQPFTVRVSDGVVTATAAVSITVSDAPPVNLTFTGGALSDAQVGVAYSASLNALGGTSPYKFALLASALPDGLSLSAAGAIAGKPTAPGAYTFTAQVTDAANATLSASFSLNVLPAPLVLISGNSLPKGVVGSDYPLQIFSATGGVPLYAFAISKGSLPGGLSFATGQISGIPTETGTFSFTVTVTDAAGKTAGADLSIQVSPAQADLILSQTFLTFSETAGTTVPPAPDNVTVRSSAVQQLLSYSYTVSPAVSWLSVTGGTTTPGSLSIAPTAAALTQLAATDAYRTSVLVTCVAPSPCAGSTQTISVALLVSAPPPQLSLANSLLSFAADLPSGGSFNAPLGIRNSGGGTLGIASVTAADSWVQVTGAPASVTPGAPATATVNVNSSGLPTGYNRSSVTVVSSAGSATVPVTFYIPALSTMRPSPAEALFSLPAGAPLSPSAGSFQVSVSSARTVGFTAEVVPGAPWLQLTTASGSSTQATPGTVSYTIDTAAAARLPQGSNYATIRISSPDVSNSPRDYHVYLQVARSGALPFPVPSPAGLLFQTGLASSKQVLVYASSSAPLPYQASAASSDGGSWLSVNPNTGTSSASAPGVSTVSVQAAGLSPGIYFGLVSYAFSAAAVRSVNVTLIVTGAPLPAAVTELSPAPLLEVRAGAACVPKQLVVTNTGLLSNFTLLATIATPLQLLVTDNCGGPVSNAQVNVTFNSGDQPVLLSRSDSVTGLYSGTWTPAAVSPQVTVSAQATASGLTSAASNVNGEVASYAGPVVTQNAILNVYNPLIGGAVAPGSILQIYGAGLSAAALSAPSIPLDTALGGTAVSIGGIPAPLYYVSPGQINAQVPFELQAGNQYDVVVSNGGALTSANPITLLPETPGIAGSLNGQIIAQHLDGTLVSPTSPAAPGTYVIFYLAGLGATDVAVRSGQASPSAPLAHPVTAPVLTLNGVQQPYQFAGMTPGIVGLYQMNFLIPASTKPGDLKLTVSQSGAVSNQVILPVR